MLRVGSFRLASSGRLRKIHEAPLSNPDGRNNFALKLTVETVFAILFPCYSCARWWASKSALNLLDLKHQFALSKAPYSCHPYFLPSSKINASSNEGRKLGS